MKIIKIHFIYLSIYEITASNRTSVDNLSLAGMACYSTNTVNQLRRLMTLIDNIKQTKLFILYY